MKNRFGVDVDYFKKELSALSRSLENRTPEELVRYLCRLAETAAPGTRKKVINQGAVDRRVFTDEAFVVAFDEVAEVVHNNAKKKGFWDAARNSGEIIALIHSELSEALEALRHNNPESKKIPGLSSLSEELADAVIRIMDFAAARNLRLAEAIIEKNGIQ